MRPNLVPLFVMILAAGCGGAEIGRTYPVRGTLTINGEPLLAKTTTVLFQPDAARGNNSKYESNGILDGTGTYQLTTQGRRGALAGWYKVIVTAYDAPPEHRKSAKPGARPVVMSLVPAKYGRAESTPLAVEVVANPAPGAYDLKLSK